ncbi:MAG: MBL fold metallo-hydrolase [Opitutales bacterium]
MLEFLSFSLPPLATNAFLLGSPDRGEAVVIDAPLGIGEAIGPELDERGWRLTGIYLTHGHFDHILGVPELAAHHAPIFAHRAEAELLANPQAQLDLFQVPLTAEPVAVDHWIEPGDHEILGERADVRLVPGHSPGSIIFHFPSLEAAFVGDTVFAGGIGRTDLPGGSFDTLAEAIRNEIYTLADITRLHPGHGPATGVKVEREGNPFVTA